MILLQGVLKMPKLNEKLKKCLKEGEEGGERHKGLKKIDPDKGLALAHLDKAMHNLKAMSFFYKNDFSDWSASAAFYTLYHCLLGLLAKFGYQSKNQECTFALIEDLIDKNEILDISKEELREIFDSDNTIDLENSSMMRDVREDMQYTTKTLLDDDKFVKLKEKTNLLLEKLRKEIER